MLTDRSQGGDRRSLIGDPRLGDEPVQRKALPGLGARDVMVFAHLGLFLRGPLSCKAPETAGAKSFGRSELGRQWAEAKPQRGYDA